MTDRLIPRREVLAFIALNGDEATMPYRVEFREYTYTDGTEWHCIDLDVDTEAALRFWAGAFGHPERYLRSSEHTGDDGARWTHYHSQHKGWRGFTTRIDARVKLGPPADVPLDDETRTRLAQIAQIAGGEQPGTES